MPQTPTDPILARALAVTFVGLVMPVMVVLMWRMALGVDPLNLTILTKGNSEMTSDTPGELRIIGGMVAGLGLLVGCAALNALRRARATGW